MRAARALRALCVAATLALVGCATAPGFEGLDAGGFHLSGRVAVRWADETASGHLVWRHTAATDDLVISTPLGQGVARLERRDGHYVLQAQDGQRHEADDPEALTEQVLGWRLPLQGLPYWVNGRPLPGVPAQADYEEGPDGAAEGRATARLKTLHQSGWLIEYLGYDEVFARPVRLRLVRDDLDIRLAIDAWHLGA